MALNKKTLSSQLLKIFKDFRNKTEADDSGLADALATAIDSYIRSAQVAPGIPVTTPAGPGATSGPGSLM